jgi:phage repressor protein C with HTH and peptisase S24 domain
MTINERFNRLIKELYNGNKSAFANSVGLTPSVVENIVGKRQGNPSFDVITKVSSITQINIEWLITGKGTMIKSEDSEEAKALPMIAAQKETYLKPVPLVSATAAAGFGSESFCIHSEDVKEYYYIPKFRFFNVDFMIEVSGKSMFPKFNNGDVVACTIVNNKDFLQWNKYYVIATRDQGILVKRLMPGADEYHLKAISDNVEYPPFEIPIEEITGIALVVGSVCLES